MEAYFDIAMVQTTTIPFIILASSYWVSGRVDLRDNAENSPPWPHLPESSIGNINVSVHWIGSNDEIYKYF